MTTTAVDIGATKILEFKFTNAAGAAADPTTIVLSIREPDGTPIAKTDADMNNPAVGTWEYNHAVTKAGRHFAHADGDGAVEAAVGIEFYARRRGAG